MTSPGTSNDISARHNAALSDSILSGLSNRQKEGASYTDGPLLIVAGPGSGKTRVMSHRLAYLTGARGIPPYRILAVTFTNKAARELRERCQRLVPSAADQLKVFTFHSFCALMLRYDGEYVGLKQGFTIYDDDDQSRVIRRILQDMDIDPKQFPVSQIRSIISSAKNKMTTPSMFLKMAETYVEEVTGRVYEKYQEALSRANAADFDDLLLKSFQLLESNADVLEKYQNRYEHVLVDEFQDTNALQFNVARLLAAKHRNLCVVGDPDQSIYSWRHADPSNLTDFRKTFPGAKIVTLDQSYRSTQIILEAADAVISNNEDRMEKTLWTENERGNRVVVAEVYDEEGEARAVINEVERLVKQQKVNRNNIAVMYRINAQSRSLEVVCNRSGVPYRLVGGVKFYERREVKDILSFLRLVSNPADDAALERVINTPARGISDRTVSELRRAAATHAVPLLDVVLSVQDEANPYGLELAARANNSVSQFADLMARLVEQSIVLTTPELIDLAMERSGYIRMLQEDKETGEERMENLRELRGSAEQYSGGEPREQLSEFLENVALVSDVDGLRTGNPLHEQSADSDAEAITLITLHQAKGLEFDAVFMVGMEEGLLPHSRSADDPFQMQEERRLCYVGMTRAKKWLYMLHAFQRRFRGSLSPSMPSRFLAELPQPLVNAQTVRSRAGQTETRKDDLWSRRAATAPAARPASQPGLEFSAGDRVRHSHFGEGVVVSVKAVPGDIEATVAFSGNGVKRLMLGFAKLERSGVAPNGGKG
jgi:DNA helicase-2/ATP-dependent DNA helicase PcrA